MTQKILWTTLRIPLVAVVYFIFAHLGLYLATLNNQVSPVWPATAIALLFLLHWGSWAAVGVFFGAFAANSLTNAPMMVCFGIAVGNALEALVGIWIFYRFSAFNKRLGPYARLINFAVVAMIPTMISATLGSFSLLVGNLLTLESIRLSWLTWWVGDSLGVLILFPLGVQIQQGKFRIFDFSDGKFWKISLTLGMTILSCVFVFMTPEGAPFLFLIYLALLLASLWLPASWIYIISILISTISILSTMVGLGPFTGGVFNENLLHLQLFLAGVGLTAIVLVPLIQGGRLKTSIFVLVFGWILTGMVFNFFYQASANKDLERFANLVEKSEKALQENLRNYIHLLEIGSGLFAVSEKVSPEEWKTYISKFHLESEYPGITGIGVITVNPNEKLRVNYIEPLKGNENVAGLLLSSEDHRLAAALKARDTGLPTIADQVKPAPEFGLDPGLILFVPFYKKNRPIETLKQRRAAFQGLVFSPVIMRNFIKTALQKMKDKIALKVFFGKQEDSASEIYSSTNNTDMKDYIQRSDILFAELPMTILWKRGEGFKAESRIMASWAVFFGSLISILLAMLLSSLENIAARAQKIAAEKNVELIQREKLWRTLTDSSPVGIYLSDAKGVVNYMNGTLVNLMNRPMSELLKVGWATFIHPEDHERVTQQWEEFKLTSDEGFKCSFRFICDSRIVYANSEAVVLRDGLGRTTGYVGTIQDTTELHLKQMALIESSRMSSLGEMVGNIAHEINNPLAIIFGKTNQLASLLEQQSFNSERARGYVQSISSNVERIAKIIKGMSSISRDVPGDSLRETCAKDIVEDTLELCRARFDREEVLFLVPTEVDENLKCVARPEQIVQVLLNLLNNALDAVSELEEKWVRIEIETYEKKMQFSVTDSGKGLSQELARKIFDPFFTTKEVGKGTGLGLSISHGIVENHNGRLYLDERSINTKFVIELNV